MSANKTLAHHLKIVGGFNNAVTQNGAAVIMSKCGPDKTIVGVMNQLSEESTATEAMVDRIVASCVYALWSDAEFRVWQKHENKAKVLAEVMVVLKSWDEELLAFVPICLNEYMDELPPNEFLNHFHDEKLARWRKNHMV